MWACTPITCLPGSVGRIPTNLGEVTFTTYWTGYASIGGLMLPFEYDTRLDWRNIDYLKIYVDHYEINSNIDDLTAPPAVRETPEPPSYAVIIRNLSARGAASLADRPGRHHCG